MRARGSLCAHVSRLWRDRQRVYMHASCATHTPCARIVSTSCLAHRLLRRALSYPKQPAVILVSLFKQWQFPHRQGEAAVDERAAVANAAAGEQQTTASSASAALGSFEYDGESRVLLLSQYYRVPSISVRNALFHDVAQGMHLESVIEASARRRDVPAMARAAQRLPNGTMQVDFMLDRIHPNGKGHALVAGVVASFLHSQASPGLRRSHRKPNAYVSTLASDAASAAVLAQEEAGAVHSQLPPPLLFASGSAFELDREALLCVRGRELLPHLVNGTQGWEYIVEGAPGNPKPGLVARESGRRLIICWRPPYRPAVDDGAGETLASRGRPMRPARYAFKLGYLKSYGAEYGAAVLSCSGVCSCDDTWLDARAGPRDRRRVSLHTVENIVLSVSPSRMRARNTSTGSAAGHASSCCVVTVESRLISELPTASVRSTSSTASRRKRGATTSRSTATSFYGHAAQHAGGRPMKFKVLSFFVGTTAVGKGRLHQQSIVLSEGVNAAVEEERG